MAAAIRGTRPPAGQATDLEQAAVLRPGDSGAAVTRLQNGLMRLGLLGGPSPSLDAATLAAVGAFQRQHPWLILDDDGIPSALQASIQASAAAISGREAWQQLIAAGDTLDMSALNDQPELCQALQRKLRALGLYPGGSQIDGRFGTGSQAALRAFCRHSGLPVAEPLRLSAAMAERLLGTAHLPAVLEAAAVLGRVADGYRRYEQQVDAGDAHLGFLDMGAELCPWKERIHQQREVLGAIAAPGTRSGASAALPFAAYPRLGELPELHSEPLAFLPEEISQACVCVGRMENGSLRTSWLGRQAMVPCECLSSTKVIGMLNVLCQLGARMPAEANDLLLCLDAGAASSTPVRLGLSDAMIDICTYRTHPESRPHPASNVLAGVLNRFEADRVGWIRQVTGTREAIQFPGRYGPQTHLQHPEIRDRASGQRLLAARADIDQGNRISTYDLTRLLSLVGWHHQLNSGQRLAGISDRGIDQLMVALGTDTGRYVDTALSTLGLEDAIASPVLLAKMGYGKTALVTTAFVQFLDVRDPGTPRLHSFALTLRAEKDRDAAVDAEAVRVDVAMATAVTELIRRLINQQLH